MFFVTLRLLFADSNLILHTLFLPGGQSARWLLVVTLRHAFPLWQIPQVASGHRQEPQGQHVRAGEARPVGQKGREGR